MCGGWPPTAMPSNSPTGPACIPRSRAVTSWSSPRRRRTTSSLGRRSYETERSSPRSRTWRNGRRSSPVRSSSPSEPEGPLPVLLDPYGGPGFQRVVRTSTAFLASQWFADQGFAVLVVDGRGTPGRGSAWERAMFRDLTVALEDQVDALQAAAERFGFLDASRVGIRGWSFGGYLAAMAALRRPDVFHAAVAGAPVTEWRLYDTHYTER